MKKRKPLNRNKSARSFRKQTGKTDRRNVAAKPMRGGFRL